LLSPQPDSPSKQKPKSARLNPQVKTLIVNVALLKERNVDAFDEAEVSKTLSNTDLPHSQRFCQLKQRGPFPLGTGRPNQSESVFEAFS